MATRASSISIAKLSAVAQEAAKAALAKAKLGHVQVDTGVIIDHQLIIGKVLRNADLAHAAQYHQVAQHITSELSKVALNPQPLPPGDRSAIYFHDHIVICGYLPMPELPIAFE